MRCLLLATILLSGCYAKTPYTPAEEEYLRNCYTYNTKSGCHNRLYHIRGAAAKARYSAANRAVLCEEKDR